MLNGDEDYKWDDYLPHCFARIYLLTNGIIVHVYKYNIYSGNMLDTVVMLINSQLE